MLLVLACVCHPKVELCAHSGLKEHTPLTLTQHTHNTWGLKECGELRGGGEAAEGELSEGFALLRREGEERGELCKLLGREGAPTEHTRQSDRLAHSMVAVQSQPGGRAWCVHGESLLLCK
jgi:hypothetical protein